MLCLFARKGPTKLTVRRKGIWSISKLERNWPLDSNLLKASFSVVDSVFVIHLVTDLLLIPNLKLCFFSKMTLMSTCRHADGFYPAVATHTLVKMLLYTKPRKSPDVIDGVAFLWLLPTMSNTFQTLSYPFSFLLPIQFAGLPPPRPPRAEPPTGPPPAQTATQRAAASPRRER